MQLQAGPALKTADFVVLLHWSASCVACQLLTQSASHSNVHHTFYSKSVFSQLCIESFARYSHATVDSDIQSVSVIQLVIYTGSEHYVTQHDRLEHPPLK